MTTTINTTDFFFDGDAEISNWPPDKNAVYRDVDACHFSLLAELDKDPALAKEMLNGKKKSSYELSLGSLVDTLLLGGNAETAYRIIRSAKPLGKMGEFADEVLRTMTTNELMTMRTTGAAYFVTDDDILLARKNIEYSMYYKEETILKKFKEEALEYCEEVISAKENGCIPITEATRNLATDMANALKSSVFTKRYFDTPITKEKLYFSYLNTRMKVEIDLISETTSGYRCADVKTCYSIKEFERNFLKYRLDLQAGLYYKALEKACAEQGNSWYKTILMPEFAFLVVDQSCRVMKFTLSAVQLGKAITGGRTWTGRYLHGLDDLIKAYKFHRETKRWDATYEQEQYNAAILDIYCL